MLRVATRDYLFFNFHFSFCFNYCSYNETCARYWFQREKLDAQQFLRGEIRFFIGENLFFIDLPSGKWIFQRGKHGKVEIRPISKKLPSPGVSGKDAEDSGKDANVSRQEMEPLGKEMELLREEAGLSGKDARVSREEMKPFGKEMELLRKEAEHSGRDAEHLAKTVQHAPKPENVFWSPLLPMPFLLYIFGG